MAQVEKVDKLEMDNFFKNKENKIESLYSDNPEIASALLLDISNRYKILSRNKWYIPIFFEWSLDDLKLLEKANINLKHDKMKSFANKHFDLLNPELSALNSDTTKFWFITLRPIVLEMSLSEYQIYQYFLQLIKNVAGSKFWSTVWGCFEITQEKQIYGIHCHLICIADSGNPTAKSNCGKSGVINKGIKPRLRMFVDENNEIYPFEWGEAGIDVEVNKGIDNTLGRARYIKGQKKNKEKDKDIEATRKFRLRNDVPPTILFKGKIPIELEEA
jgi:hypothetical protein